MDLSCRIHFKLRVNLCHLTKLYRGTANTGGQPVFFWGERESSELFELFQNERIKMVDCN